MKTIKFEKNVSLKNYCTFKIGGNAKYLYVANNTVDLLRSVKYCITNNIKYKIIGLGANILFDDLGYNGAVIVNKSNKCRIVGSKVYCNSGETIGNLITKCYLKSLTGLENLAGIPSTVGGATVNSLGAFNTNFCDFIEYVRCVDVKNLDNILKISQKECNFSYRNSIFKNKNYIILSVRLNLSFCDKLIIKSKMLEAIKKKSTSQPLNYPNAGSIFKRIGDFIPSKIIDELGLKGTKVGDAQISKKHAGFIVNLGNATSEDVKQLIKLIENKVYKQTNVKLEKEIEFVTNT